MAGDAMLITLVIRQKTKLASDRYPLIDHFVFYIRRKMGTGRSAILLTFDKRNDAISQLRGSPHLLVPVFVTINIF